MCGIAGIVHSRGDALAAMHRMLTALRHRGPDDEGIYQGTDAILGQRRLSIIDLAGGRQPISNEAGTLWLVCNGEIYNYRALRRDLEEQGVHFATRSDSEVIVHLYEKLGVRCVEQLRGMFAFAIWDCQQRSLFVARDHLGQKPFYYCHRGPELAFGSEIKALLAMDPALRELDSEALDQYLTLRVIAPPRSMFRAIRKLPPGHWLLYNPGTEPRIQRYWDLKYEPKHGGSEADLVDELEARLVEALRLHMVSDVPVGAYVSGGLDSSLVLAMLMKHVAAEPIPSFSMSLPHDQFDEAPAARLVARTCGSRHYEQTFIPSLIRKLPTLVWHLDEPSDPLSLCAYAIAQMASEHVKVVLGGDGGDELFGGYDRYYGNRYASYYARVPRAIRKYGVGPVLSLVPEGGWYKSKGHQLKWLHELSFTDGAARYARSLSYFYFDSRRKSQLYGPAMRGQLNGFDAEADVRESFERAGASDSLDRMLYADSQSRLPDHPVMILDRMTMAHGLEARSPFMDHKLAEFTARLPCELKVRGRSLRYIQRQLARRYLPQEVLDRPKQGFSSALPYMLRGEYRLLFELFLRESQLVKSAIFDRSFIQRMLSEHLSGRRDHGNRLWLLLNSEVWYRMFIQGDTVQDLTTQLMQEIHPHAA